MEFDLENPLTNFDDFHVSSTVPSFIPSFFLVESDHMPTETYIKTLKASDLATSIRREAICSISQFSCKFSPFLSYLAVNYLDRFLSSQGLPQPNTWVLRLVAISCVSLAAKMNKLEFELTHFQGDGGFMFEAQTIERMEYLKDPPLMDVLKARAVEIIMEAQNDIKLLEFKPSIIAATALVCASHELFPSQFPSFRKAISYCPYVNKENMLNCYNSIIDMGWRSNQAEDMVSQQFSSSEGDMFKRRKTNDYEKNHTGHLSQVQHC
ncbi:Putative cyclin-D6-1 -like protein [Gossypium arboreum]|uniref:Putative cyclin-D6-1-like protein n=1 Tax=Gossypium arboreum TaxID=29729 RepID=A0A0B0NVR3_GOSAR|nr:Putative cyclin-D6-1 -like protein [Gossypium arboreum]